MLRRVGPGTNKSCERQKEFLAQAVDLVIRRKPGLRMDSGSVAVAAATAYACVVHHFSRGDASEDTLGADGSSEISSS